MTKSRGTRWIATFLGALLGGSVLGVLPILPMGLGLDERVLFPLALIIGSLVAGICASIVHHGAMLKVVGISIATGIVFVILPPLTNFLQNNYQWYTGPWLMTGMFIVALAGTIAASRFPGKDDLRRNLVTGVGLIMLAIVLVYMTVFVASRFGLTGA